MLTRKIVYLAGLVLGIGLLVSSPILAQSPYPAPTPPATGPFYNANVQVVALDKPVDYVQDVKGSVVGSDGKGVDGISVKVTSPGWQALDATRGGGAFKFTLTKGEFVVTLEGVQSQEAKFIVDGKSDITIRFSESGRTPTVTTPTVTTTPTTTATPTTTSTPEPTKTIVVVASTPSSGGNTASTPTPTAIPQSRRPSNDLSMDGWVKVFSTGAGLGFIIMVAGVGIFIVRRRRS